MILDSMEFLASNFNRGTFISTLVKTSSDDRICSYKRIMSATRVPGFKANYPTVSITYCLNINGVERLPIHINFFINTWTFKGICVPSIAPMTRGNPDIAANFVIVFCMCPC